jgi:hypothetical protein
MERETPEQIGKRIEALGLWDAVLPYNWAVKPSGVAFPYFCSAMKGSPQPVKMRLLMLEGWGTFHDYIRFGVDRNAGFYSTPAEMPHYELVVLSDGGVMLFRHDPGYVPRTLSGDAERDLVARILWESYGVMLRLESDRELPMKYAGERAMFARVESRDGKWSDAPLPIPDPRPVVEKVSFRKEDVAKAKDLPLDQSLAVELDFRIMPNIVTRESRPRTAYQLTAVDAASGARTMLERVSAGPDFGLKEMWESMPPRVLANFVKQGRVPGEVKVLTQRMFRLLRPLCLELPVRLSLHDSLPTLEKAFSAAP